jgi:glycogen phosphorylase
MPSLIDIQADKIVAKTKHYLITTMGRVLEEANLDELYRALSYTLREEVMINWLASERTIAKHNVRVLYYLSMEYLPGRILSNNITNLHADDIIRIILQKLNRTYDDIVTKERDPGLGNGGLGRLASCFLDSLATQHFPSRGYGLRYQYGIFEQQLWNGQQIEAPDTWLANEYPWEFRRDLRKVYVKYGGHITPKHNIHGDEIYQLDGYEQVWALPFDIPIIGYNRDNTYNVTTLRLWSTKESPRNFLLQRYNAGRLDEAAENSTLTDVLYPSDHHETGKRVRLKQEFLLVSASLQDIIRHYLTSHNNFRDFADKVRIQINDTHATLIIPELIRQLIQTYDLPWNMAVEITRESTGYTNHTILKEALEQWDHNLMYYLLPQQFKIIERINYDLCEAVRKKYPSDEARVQRMSIIHDGLVRMANLAIYGSHKVNGVAALHTEILKNSVFKDFYEMNSDKFINVTNGVTQRRWLLHCNPELAHFITQRIGDGWITDFMQIKRLADFAGDIDSQREFLSIKRRNKQQLISKIFKTEKMRDGSGNAKEAYPLVDADALFDVHVKRIHEYKRQLMNALHLIMLYQEIIEDPHTKRIKRLALFGGKAAPGYEMAKNIIFLINCIARRINRDPKTHGLLKIIFIENYCVSRAELIIPAADLSEQISTAGTEASGTGNMKLAMNGALTIGTNDGANIEMRQEVTDKWWPFAFGCSTEEIGKMRSEQTYHPQSIYNDNPKIKKALDTLVNRTFAENDYEHQIFSNIYHSLLDGYPGTPADRYFILKDLEGYYDTQLKAEQLYLKPFQWAEYAIHNIAGMGKFSTDYSIRNYCEKIWGLQPLPLDDEILERVRHDYSEHDQCRIY